jgi:hypothetical protein
MRSSLAALVAAVAVCMLAAPARCDTRVGIQGILLSGSHIEPKGTVKGTGGGIFFRVDQRWSAIQLHLEGIPSVAIARVDTGFGPVTANIGMFAATARFRALRDDRLWVGVGTQVIAQQTPLLGLSKVDNSRLSGSRFEVVGHVPVATNRFIEGQIAAMPHLSGLLHQTTTLPDGFRYTVVGPETASLIDFAAAYGITYGKTEYLIGVRAINFAAKFADGREADRNVGSGVTAEVRFTL